MRMLASQAIPAAFAGLGHHAVLRQLQQVAPLRPLSRVTLKICAQCRKSQYCSRDCRKGDWKQHSKECGRPPCTSFGGTDNPNFFTSAAAAAEATKNLDSTIMNLFTRLDNGTYLQDRSEADVYRVPVDLYRLRLTDEGLYCKPDIIEHYGNSICPMQL
ncbi:hypothetical protein B0H67DRAFT_684969 [Lasiosphaeris hirsuta]|uniref:MYND-type domain-containing protein n=1 Tax=Lasiosphaeris hirsuta TaxID=260670 RepID=A0AA40DQ11_9PEZI|nr:hypothetical protein B0H67DRAFT_684969 [Lasiosphaeris hirsuta]